MTLRLVHLGSISDLAARYLDSTDAWSDPVVLAEAERRQDENDVIVGTIAIKRARAERRALSDLDRELVRRAKDHVRRGTHALALFRPIAKYWRHADGADDGVPRN